jgi:hypothetical protein
MSANNTEKLPSITPVVAGAEETKMEAHDQVREIIEVREGRRNPESGDRFVTVAELIAAGVLPAGYT